jgi:hypothetical protein
MGDALTPVKICTRCGEEKAATAQFFSRSKDGRHGVRARCKSCDTAAMREYRRAHPAAFSRYERDRHQRHADARRASMRRYYEEHSEELNQRRRQYRAANRERLLAARRARLEIEKHDPNFKVAKAISGSLLRALRHKKNGAMWETLVGYDREQLVRHLERQFKRGMSWANFGTKWHIDHIRPVSSFTFTSADDTEVKACWALTNLRPLWKLDNLSKHAKRTHLI